MRPNEMTIEQARAAEARAYIVHTAALTAAVQAYRNGLVLKPFVADVEKAREEWQLAQDALDLVLMLNGEPARRRS